MTLTLRGSGTAVRPVPGRPSLGARAFAALDIIATGVRGVEGAALAAHAGFDLLGVLVVGFVTAVVGGMLRDVLLGDLPPAALRSSSRILVALAASGAAFVLLRLVDDTGFLLSRASAVAVRATNTVLEPFGLRVRQYSLLLAVASRLG